MWAVSIQGCIYFSEFPPPRKRKCGEGEKNICVKRQLKPFCLILFLQKFIDFPPQNSFAFPNKANTKNIICGEKNIFQGGGGGLIFRDLHPFSIFQTFVIPNMSSKFS